VLPWDPVLAVVWPPEFPLLDVELRTVPVTLSFYLLDPSGVSLLWVKFLLLEDYVNIVADFVIELVMAVVAVLRKLLLGHLNPAPKPQVLLVVDDIKLFCKKLLMAAFTVGLAILVF